MTSPITPQTTVLELGAYLSAKEATFSAGYSGGLWHFAVSMDGRMVIGEGADLVTAIDDAIEKTEGA